MKINCIMGQHRYRASDMEMYLAEEKPKSRVYRVIRKCCFCGKEKAELVEIPNPMDEQTDYHIENDGTYRGGENEKDSNRI